MRKLFLVAVLIFISSKALAGGCPDSYFCAKFYENHHWSRDGLIAYWVLDPGTEGNLLVNEHVWFGSTGDDGNFESWRGTINGCTNVPTGWDVTCAGGGDVDQETVYIYRNNASVRVEPSGAFVPILTTSMNYDFDANTAYMVVFYYYGVGGTEDMSFVVGDNGFAETYDFATDTWTAPNTGHTITNAPTAWTRAVLYLVVGPVAKTSYQIAFVPASGNGSGFIVDNMSVQRLKSPSITGSMGNVLSVPVTSDPLWGHSEELLPRVGTGPVGWWGSWFDDVNDYFSCADADCEMDPVLWSTGGSFTVGCRVMTHTIAAGTRGIISRYAAPPQRSWSLARTNDDIYFYVTDDGVTSTSVAKMNIIGVDIFHNIIVRYNYDGVNLSADANLYVDELAVATSAVMRGPPNDVTSPLEIGAFGAANFWFGFIQECFIWEGDVGDLAANKWRNPHFPATNYGDGYVDTCSQAASHATCSTQVCRDGTPNACQAEGTGVMSIFSGQTEQLDNNSYEAIVGDPSAGNFSDWTEGGFITAYLTDAKHGDVSARMKGGSLSSECIIGGGVDTYFEISAKSLVEGGILEVWLREYDTGFCTNQLAITTIITCTPGSVWDDCGALFEAATWHADTSSYKIQIIDSVNGDMLVDAVSVKEASHRTPWVHCPTGSGTVSYNNRQYILNSPLARYVESEDGYAYASGFCGSAWIYSDWTGDDGVTHQIMTSPGTVGINNRWIVNKPNSNNIQFVLYDAAGALRQYTLIATSTNWSAGGWKFLEWCSSNTDNVLKGRHYNVNNKVWYNWTSAAGAGTGIQDGQSTDLHIGHDANTNYLNGGVSEIYLSPYSDIWPQKGFNFGNPPINHAPY